MAVGIKSQTLFESSKTLPSVYFPVIEVNMQTGALAKLLQYETLQKRYSKKISIGSTLVILILRQEC